MKARLVQTLPNFSGGQFNVVVDVVRGNETSQNRFTVDDPDNRQLTEPVRAIGHYEREIGNYKADDVLVWMYRNRVVVVDPPYEFSLAEILLTIVHLVHSQEQVFAEMLNDIERFRRLDDGERAVREAIPSDVRAFVWRRDQGRCVRCDSAERLEFDHIIPLAKGGSNTERNIQLLCEACNRSKGTTI